MHSVEHTLRALGEIIDTGDNIQRNIAAVDRAFVLIPSVRWHASTLVIQILVQASTTR